MSTLKPEANLRAVSLLHDAGIAVCGSFIVGVPGETASDLEMTLHLIESSGVDLVNVHLLTPYPGTPVWDEAELVGLVSPHMQWSTLQTRGDDIRARVFLNLSMPLDEFEEYWRILVAKASQLRNNFSKNLPNL